MVLLEVLRRRARTLSDAIRDSDEEVRMRATQQLRHLLDRAGAELGGDAYASLVDTLLTAALEMIQTPPKDRAVAWRLGALGVMDALCDDKARAPQQSDVDSIVGRVQSYLLLLFDQGDRQVIPQAARVVGRFAVSQLASGVLTAVIERQVQVATGWLQCSGSSWQDVQRRHAGVLVLKELAECVPTQFNVQLERFLNYILTACCDADDAIRRDAVLALRHGLTLVARRADASFRATAYERLYNDAKRRMDARHARYEALHGALLILGELLRGSGDGFMSARYKDTMDLVLRFRRHSDQRVKLAVIELVPQLAAFSPSVFVKSWLHPCGDFLSEHVQRDVKLGRSSKERDKVADALGLQTAAFLSMGRLALAVNTHMEQWLVPTVRYCRNRLLHVSQLLQLIGTSSSSSVVPSLSRSKSVTSVQSEALLAQELAAPALRCLSMLAEALGPRMQGPVVGVVDLLFADGQGALLLFNETFVQTLQRLVRFIPELLGLIQDRLLRVVTDILLGVHAPYALLQEAERAAAQSGKSTPSAMALLVAASSGSERAQKQQLTLAYDAYLRHQSVYGSELSTFAIGTPATGSTRGSGSVSARDSLMSTALDAHAVQQRAALALRTLGNFNFAPHDLLPLVRETVTCFLDAASPVLRAEAAKCCAKIVLQVYGDSDAADAPCAADAVRSLSDERRSLELATRERHRAALVAQILERLLSVAAADLDASIRGAVLHTLEPMLQTKDARLRQVLAQPWALQKLLTALNDESESNRATATTLVGKLSASNAAAVLPALRKLLLQLLAELHYSVDSASRRSSAEQLRCLVAAAPELVQPYVASILKVLLPRVDDQDADVATAVLAALGELAHVGGTDMARCTDELLALLVGLLRDQQRLARGDDAASPHERARGNSDAAAGAAGAATGADTAADDARREARRHVRPDVVLRVMSALVESSGRVVAPYLRHERLLDVLLHYVSPTHGWHVRKEAIRCIGVLGALDPFQYRQIRQGRLARHSEEAFPDYSATGGGDDGDGDDEDSKQNGRVTDLALLQRQFRLRTDTKDGSKSSNADAFYERFVLHALLNMLNDSSLLRLHHQCVAAVDSIFATLRDRCADFLDTSVPTLLRVLRHTRSDTS
ncbi:MAG: hypothetical protein MHM6MM_004060, partial [Cercozoa sp. M6MM]